jgi:formylglycine-generating enzyme required for sulfatase activity
MTDFYRKFLAEDVRKMGAPSGRQIFLAAFGKHPGWDDHIEDLGLESESLIYAKSNLYVQGIRGQIDSGAWEKLDETQRVGAFKHLLLWHRSGQAIVGRMWSSSDGKGRTRYPMIVCAHCAGVPLEWALAEILPRLEQIEQACAATKSAADVRAILDRHRTELRAAVANFSASAASPITSAVISDFVNQSALGPDKEGWFRILHQMHGQMAMFAPGRFSPKSEVRPQQLRLPACALSPSHTLLLWSKFLQAHVDSAVPLLYALPLDETWVDITAGEPTPHEVFPWRASSKAVPLASEVPYNLEPAFREKARAQVAAFAGDTAMKPRPAAVPQGAEPAPPVTGGKLKLLRWLGGGAALLAVAGLAVALTFGNRGKSKQLAAAPSPSPALPEAKVDDQARAEQERKQALAAEAEKRRLAEEAQAKARAAEAEKQRQAEVIAKAKAEEAEKQRQAEQAAKAREAEIAKARAEAEAQAKAKADAEAQSKIPNPKPKTDEPVLVASVPPASVPEAKPAAAAPSRYKTNSVGIELAPLPGDIFVSRYEITQGQFSKVMGEKADKFTGDHRLPVRLVTWQEAKQFCEKLTELEKAAGTLPAGFVYDLPTQAQWDTLLADAAFDQAVTSRKQQPQRKVPELVGTFPANTHGLHDVLGNVWEWCLDGTNSETRAARGGAYNNLATFNFKPLTVATVRSLRPDAKFADLGFRCVLVKTQ